MRNIEPGCVLKTMNMFLILMESYTLDGPHLFPDLCIQGRWSA